jgi:D-alanyl-D-alanine carboxypeptidase
MGIAPETIRKRALPLYDEAKDLVALSEDQDRGVFLLTHPAADAWNWMKTTAAQDGVEIYLVSAFRSVARQRELIMQKIARGQELDEVLEVLAPPGCSEHHTGNAVDLGCKEALPLDPVFEIAPAFSWLKRNASRFGFKLSYPRDNRYGYVYEPWHWCYSDAIE